MERLQRFQKIMELNIFSLILQGTEAPNFVQEAPAAHRLRVELAECWDQTQPVRTRGKVNSVLLL